MLDAGGQQKQRVDEIRIAHDMQGQYQRSFTEIQKNSNEIKLINKFWSSLLDNSMKIPEEKPSKASAEQSLKFLKELEKLSAQRIKTAEERLSYYLNRFFQLSNEGLSVLANCERKTDEFIKHCNQHRTIVIQKINEIVPTLSKENLAKLTTFLWTQSKYLCLGSTTEPPQKVHAKLVQVLQPPAVASEAELSDESEQGYNQSQSEESEGSQARLGELPSMPVPGVWKLSTQYQACLQSLARDLNLDGGSLRYERFHPEHCKTSDYTQAIIGTIGVLNDKSMKRMFWEKVHKTFFNDGLQERSVEKLHLLIRQARQEQMHVEQNLTFSALMARQRTQDEKRFQHLLTSFLRKRGALDPSVEPSVQKKSNLPEFLRDESELPGPSLEAIESTFRNALIETRNETRGSTSHSEESSALKNKSPQFYNSQSSSSDQDDSYLYETLSCCSDQKKEGKEESSEERKRKALTFCMKAICKASFHGQKKSIFASKFQQQSETIVINKKQPHHRRIHNEDEEESGMRETDFNDELSFTLKLLIEQFLQAKERNIGVLEGLVHKVVQDTPEMKRIKNINIEQEAKEVKTKMQQHKRKRERKRGAPHSDLPSLKILKAPEITQKSATPSSLLSPTPMLSEWGRVSNKRPPEELRASPSLLEKRRSYAKPSSHSRCSFKQLPGKSQPEPQKQLQEVAEEENSSSNQFYGIQFNSFNEPLYENQQQIQDYYQRYPIMNGGQQEAEGLDELNQEEMMEYEEEYREEDDYRIDYGTKGLLQNEEEDGCYQVGIRHSIPQAYVGEEEEAERPERSPPFPFFRHEQTEQHSPRLFSHIIYHDVQE